MKEQELQLEKIFDTIQLVSQSNSAVFQEYSRLDKGKINPLSSLMVDNLKLLSQDFLFTKMPELCDIINKTASEQLINWLIEQPSFQQWLSPADKLFFDYFQSTNKRQEIFKSTFFNCEEHKDDKNKSFILDSCFNSSIGADYTILAKDKFDEDLWKNVIETFDSNKKEQKKFVTKMIEEIKNADKPTTLNNIFTVFMVTMNKDILSPKEADILFTSQLVNKSDSLLMPKSKLEKIEYAINIKVHLDFQFLQKYHKLVS